MTGPTSTLDISARLDRLPGNPMLWSWVGRLSLGGFFEIYDLALTALLSPLLVGAGVFRAGSDGLLGYPDQASFAFLTMLGLFLGALGLSGVADRYSRRSLFMASLLWYSAATLMMALQSTASGVCLWRFVASIGLGLELVVIECYLAEITPKRLRGRVFAVSKSVQVCAIPIAGFFAHAAGTEGWLGMPGWRWVALAPVAGALIVLLIRRSIPESPRWLEARGRQREANIIVRKIERYVEQRSGQPLPPPERIASVQPPQRHARYADIFQPPHRRRMLMLIVVDCASSIAYYGFAHWAPTLLEHQGVNITRSLLYTAAIGLAYPVAPLIGALFADRIERKWQVAIVGVLGAVFGLLFARQDSAAMWIVCGVLLTIAIEIKSTAAHTYRSELFPTHLRAKAVGLIYSFSRLAGAASSYVIAFVLLRSGVPGVFAVIITLLLLSVAVILRFGPRTRGLSYEEINDDLPAANVAREGVNAR